MGLEKTVKWSDELAEELHRPVKRKFKRRKAEAHRKDQIWASDLVDMHTWEKYSKGYRYLLSITDVLSKYGWMVPLKDEKGETVVSAFREVMKHSRKPENL